MQLKIVTSGGGHDTVRARQLSEFFALIPSSRRGWTDNSYELIHIPTGMGVKSHLCCEKSAVELAKALAGFRWNFVKIGDRWTPKFPKRVQKSMDRARVVVREWKCPESTAHPKTLALTSPARSKPKGPSS